MSKNKCYRCENVKTSKEHTPPKSFFPLTHRSNLVTVPSCSEHNTKKSGNDEKIRNVIAMHRSVNPEALSLINKIKRSIIRSPSLAFIKEAFKIGDAEGFLVNTTDFDSFFKSLGYSIYYAQHLEPFKGDWIVYPKSFHEDSYIAGPDRLPKEHEESLKSITSLNFTNLEKFRNPTVFQCYYAEHDKSFVYKMIFYEGFECYLIASHANDA